MLTISIRRRPVQQLTLDHIGHPLITAINEEFADVADFFWRVIARTAFSIFLVEMERWRFGNLLPSRCSLHDFGQGCGVAVLRPFTRTFLLFLLAIFQRDDRRLRDVVDKFVHHVAGVISLRSNSSLS